MESAPLTCVSERVSKFKRHLNHNNGVRKDGLEAGSEDASGRSSAVLEMPATRLI